MSFTTSGRPPGSFDLQSSTVKSTSEIQGTSTRTPQRKLLGPLLPFHLQEPLRLPMPPLLLLENLLARNCNRLLLRGRYAEPVRDW